MPDVEIEYCVPCSLLEPAQRAQEALLTTFGQDLDGVRLKPGDGGVFKVRFDGDLIWDENVADLDVQDLKARVGHRL